MKVKIPVNEKKVEKDAREQRRLNRKGKDKTKITNSDIWEVVMDIESRMAEIQELLKGV